MLVKQRWGNFEALGADGGPCVGTARGDLAISGRRVVLNVELTSYLEKKLSLVEWGRLHYSSSPDRGLDNVLYLLPWIREKCPEVKLHIFYSFFNWEAAARSRNNSQELKQIEELQKAIERAGDSVVNHGRLGQKELFGEWWKAWVWLYPTSFTETSCCPAGTIIKTQDRNPKPIELVEAGDKVLTHTGDYSSVTNVMKRHYEGDLVTLKTKYTLSDLVLTPNHPVLVLPLKAAKCSRIQTARCNKDKPQCREHKYVHLGKRYHSTKECLKLQRPFTPVWVEAGEIDIGDLLCIPKVLGENPVNRYKFSDFIPEEEWDVYRRDGSAHPFRDLVLDDDLLEFFGWYIAEGSTGPVNRQGQIVFSLNKDEHQESEFIMSQLLRLGLPSIVRTRSDNTRLVRTNCALLARFFNREFGKGARNKRLPSWVKTLANKHSRHLLRGLFHGDGNWSKNFARLEVGSRTLIEDVVDLLVKHDCLPSVSESLKPALKRAGNSVVKDHARPKASYWSVYISLSHNPELFSFFGYEPDPKGIRPYISDDAFVYTPVQEITKFPYVGTVYNFSVEEDESYVANGVTVHNCLTAQEALITGTPPITSNVAALQTTVGPFGLRIEEHPYSKEAREKALAEVVRLYHNREAWIQSCIKALEGGYTRRVSWQQRFEDYWLPLAEGRPISQAHI